MKIAILPFDMASPGDGSGLRRALRRLAIRDVLQLAVIAKIEGTATLNDVSRELASERVAAELRRAGGTGLEHRSLTLLSVGCEGIITPGGWIIASLRSRTSRRVGLAVGHARSRPIAMHDRASRRHMRAAASAVRAAMRTAGLDRHSVELVLIKSPIRLPSGSTAASRGAAALGSALALGEVRYSSIDDASLCVDWSLHGSKTMAFSGTETDCCEVLVLGHRLGGDPRLRVDRAQLSDLMDSAPLGDLAAGGEALLVFYKAGIARDGTLRGARTTVLSSEVPSDKQLRAAASGVVAAMLGTTRAFISGGAEHQAAPGGCMAAVIRNILKDAPPSCRSTY
jgi:cyanuric acid amidohydrolase